MTPSAMGAFSSFSREFSSLRKRILFSYCIYIFTFSGRAVSFSPSRSSHIATRSSSLCTYCSKYDVPHSECQDTAVNQNLIQAPSSGKITSIVPKEPKESKDDLGTTSTLSSEGSGNIPKGYQDSRVLLVGDGDLSFAASLSTLNVCKSLTATTWDSKERLVKSFPRAAENIRIIEENGDTVQYGVDATQLTDCMQGQNSFDLIAWNFPHIAGKQNIKRNRELVQNFMESAFALLDSKDTGEGMVKISLCDGQSGTRAIDMDDWNFSWKLVHQAAEAGCLLTDIETFPLNAFPGYVVTGHRGHGGDFPTGAEPQIFTFRRSAEGAVHSVPVMHVMAGVSGASALTAVSSDGGEMMSGSLEAGASASDNSNSNSNGISTTDDSAVDTQQLVDYTALQAPSYIHEVHLLAVSMVTDLIDLERRAREGVKIIVANFEAEEERERVRGGAERARTLDLIRLEKQLLPVRRRYRTQEDRDIMTAAKLAIVDMSGPSESPFVDPSSGSSADDSSIDSNIDRSVDIIPPISDSNDDSVSIDGSIDDSGSEGSEGSDIIIEYTASSTGRHASSVWAVNLVDVYTCPRTLQISHAFQVTYCSLTRPIGRTVADTYRKRVERDLPVYLGMVPRVVKHGGLVSLSYPWYVTAAVQAHLASATAIPSGLSSGISTGGSGGMEIGIEGIEGGIEGVRGPEGRVKAEVVDVSDLAAILRELELEEKNSKTAASFFLSDSASSDDVTASGSDDVISSDVIQSEGVDQNRENIRTIARTLWKKRVGVLMQDTAKNVPQNVPQKNVPQTASTSSD